MMIRTLLTAAAAMALLASGAHAGDGMKKKPKPAEAAASQMKEDMPGKAASDMDASPKAPDTSVNPPVSADAASAAVDTSAVVAVQTVTNGPVADTPENRALYKPLSRAGRHTAPRGN